MKIQPLAIHDVLLITPKVFEDERGFFMESFNQRDFRAATGLDVAFVQDNHSLSTQGVLRGLHYQYNNPQGKLVRVTRGEVFDVAVDMRQHSATFGQWCAATLNAEEKQMMWIPPGFAHGFYAVSLEAELQYKCTDYYAPGDEVCVHWNDNMLCIEWPFDQKRPPVVSEKDAQGVNFSHAPAFL